MNYANILTGSIGCGKSTVARLLMLSGFHIIDADIIARNAMEKESLKVIEAFGKDIIEQPCNISSSNTHKPKINRTLLGQIIFHDSAKKAILESILHPVIQHDILESCNNLEVKKTPYFVDIPLFFESSFAYPARFIICVYANRNLQIQRIMARNKLDESEAIKRVDSQIDIEIKRKKSDFVIENISDLKTLQKNVESFLQDFLLHYSYD